jgi:hypothetical protein
VKADLLEGFKLCSTNAAPGLLSAMAKRAIVVLDKLPFKELVDTRELCARMKCAISTFHRDSANPDLKDYCFSVSENRKVWGSKRTIKELKRLNEEK